jgi:phosphoenolpyruvate-protein phosphotransferase
MKILRGIPAAPGIVIGPAYVYRPLPLTIPRVTGYDPDQEWQRLQRAIAIARVQISDLQTRAEAAASHEEAQIFAAHLLMLDDPTVMDAIRSQLEETHLNVEAVWQDAMTAYAQQLEALDDDYLRARAADVRDITRRVLALLLGVTDTSIHLPYPAVLVAPDLSPSDTIALDRRLLLGFCTAAGGPTSHTAILARSLGLPAVVGVGEEVLTLSSTTNVILDGSQGELIADPDAPTLAAYRRRQERLAVGRQQAALRAHDPAITRDGHRVEVVANIGNVDEANEAIQQGAEGVGLLRTEFLFLERSAPPSEDEQYQAYRAIAEVMGQRPVIVRTLDIGGDKPAPYLDMRSEANPFLGRRAIRLTLGMPEFFKTQLRAIARAGAGHNLKIMFPMVATIAEVRQLRALVRDVQDELRRAGLPQAESLEVGIMVEIPAAAIMADVLAAEVDFFSIGTNDLTQYTMAVDRTNADVASLADALHPAVLRLIKQTIEGAHAAGKWVGLCGEMAGDPLAAPLLLGLGLDEFSMAPAMIPTIKEIIRSLSWSDVRPLVQRALTCPDATAVREVVSPFLRHLGYDL